MEEEIGKLDVFKASQVLDIPIRLIKRKCDNFSDFLCGNINTAFGESVFLQQVKYADKNPVFKKSSRSENEYLRISQYFV